MGVWGDPTTGKALELSTGFDHTRTLIQLLWGFSYRFWMKSLPSTSRWPKNIIIDQLPEKDRPLLKRKMAAMERVVNLNALALGI